MSTVPGAVDLHAVPARRDAPAVEWVEVDHEVVAWNTEREELHHLDPIATLVFLLCDGVTPLRATVAELSASFEQPSRDIEQDVLALVSGFARDGLVQLR